MENTLQRSKITPKAYRIHRIYKCLFEALTGIYGTEKGEIILHLAKHQRIEDATYIMSIKEKNRGSLIEMMLDELFARNESIDKVRKVNLEHRINYLTSYYYDRIGREVTDSVMFTKRFLPVYRELIEEYSTERLGEVIELAITNYINTINDYEYNLFQIEFMYQVRKVFIEKWILKDFPFRTHTIYVHHDEKNIYKLTPEFYMQQVSEIKTHSPKYPNIILYKKDFDIWKNELLNSNFTGKEFSLDEEAVNQFYKVGFLSQQEVDEYLQKP